MDRTLKWVLGGAGGCLVLVLLVIVGAVVWLATRPDDGDADEVDLRPAVIDTMGLIEDEPWQGTAERSRILTGRVIDARTSIPIADAQITLLGPSGVPYILYTDPTGNFNASLDETGSYMLTATAAGYLTGFYPNAFDVTEETPEFSGLEDITLEPQ